MGTAITMLLVPSAADQFLFDTFASGDVFTGNHKVRDFVRLVFDRGYRDTLPQLTAVTSFLDNVPPPESARNQGFRDLL